MGLESDSDSEDVIEDLKPCATMPIHIQKHMATYVNAFFMHNASRLFRFNFFKWYFFPHIA